ncbi:hypothetical protein O6H91_06G049300 [Diphasiastrum complanatum]|uniref:Uncharacterized protein n=5 Tax=Diphasiastrum complanatum TaxID=34168 RepID=A0ACC2DDE3_DIPCM|nr:hypothetical protein O6H91_06G049300 [Diphasiastrum complanatum]KAJ7552298.1 hypothetical protein O6H91_06G049300 [Diphasiastrum complanatum]KAJ7552299.1 hypothetical protein O6H91_06G049300 [Diphasiastrum complanatum]KAJ7552300.1 hypothetical protein O6H91_06G049300 [Diphasiastrum complanatum]KAJ7552301.1 hypothetical protein O6H91_06G049300 [Diphasiastrum complanatum]
MSRMERETRYKEWMERVTLNAVEKALQCYTISQSTSGLQTGSADVGPPLPRSRVGPFNGSSVCGRNQGQTKNWSLDRNSTDRRDIAASIYTLLLQWNPDVSGQWASRVAAVVPILEEALYQKTNSLEDYKNTILLDVHLRQILREFESGNGPVFFSQPRSETCVRPEEEEGRVAKAKSVRTHNFAINKTDNFGKVKQIKGQIITDDQKTADEEELQYYPESVILKENRHPARDNRELIAREADIALWDAIYSGSVKKMEENLSKFQNSASKKLVHRVAGLISLKKQYKSVAKIEDLQTGLGDSGKEKLKKISLKCPEASEEKKVLGDDLRHVLNERSTIAEQRNGLKKDTPYGRTPAFVDVDVKSQQSLSAEESPYASRAELSTCPRSIRLPLPVNQKIDSSKGVAELDISLEVSKDLDCPQVQLFLKPSAVSSDILHDSSTCSVVPPTPEERCIHSALSRYVEIDSFCLPSASASNQNKLRELKSSQDQDYRELSSLRSLFQLDDDDAHVPNVQGDFPGGGRALSESPNAENSQEQQRRNTEQVARSEVASQTECSITENEVFRMQTDSIRVSLLSLLTERHHMDGRVSLMSLLRERNDYEVVIFDQDILASMNSSCLSHIEDDHEPLELHAICCVCMVGQRGAAFVPCGHTFCRKCACELQMSRGTCPLCNRSIKQILKLY